MRLINLCIEGYKMLVEVEEELIFEGCKNCEFEEGMFLGDEVWGEFLIWIMRGKGGWVFEGVVGLGVGVF